MRTIVNGVVSFGMVAIPVSIAGVKTSKNEPNFRTLHEKCKTPINEVKRCLECDVDADEVVKGFEITKGEYAVFTAEELASITSDRDKTINLTKFIRASDIKPFMVDSTYWLVPPDNAKLAEKYGLLYQSLAEMKKVGLGTESLWGKEKPCVVVPNQDFPTGGVLQLWTLHLYEDLVEPDFAAPIPGREEKKLAKTLIEAQSADFDPTVDLATETRTRMNELIAARIDEKPLPEFGKPQEKEQDTNLMEALRASVAEIEERKKPSRKKVAAKK